MDRFFATLPFGKIVKRSNWALQTTPDLFVLHGNHISAPSSTTNSDSSSLTMAPATYNPTPSELEEWKKAADEVEPEKCFLRCERQTLHRLEKTGAAIFGFKTYLYGLGEVRKQGEGEEMANAVEGMGRGSVKGMFVYKKVVVWGDKVVSFLRAE
jgi:hypothetical protein